MARLSRQPARLVACVSAIALVVASGSAGHAYPRPGHTVLVSRPTQGPWAAPVGLALGQCEKRNNDVMDITPDGRYVAFASMAPNLVPADRNLACDVFRKDLRTGRIIRVSVSSDEREAHVPGVPTVNEPPAPTPDSTGPSISADGRFVAFASWAQDLAPGKSNGRWNVFVRDVLLGTTRVVSVSSAGAMGSSTRPQAPPDSAWPSLSNNGRYVAFGSSADNLVAGDANDHPDVFVHDLHTSKTALASYGEDGKATGGGEPSISGDGRFVSINETGGLYVHDLRKRTRVRVDLSSQGQPGNNYTSNSDNLGGDQISADGRYVVFTSLSDVFVPNDHNGTPGLVSALDVFVRDRKLRRTERVTVTAFGEELASGNARSALGGGAAISPDGRYVIFDSIDSALAPRESEQNDRDVFVHDRVTGAVTRVSVDRFGGDKAQCSKTAPPSEAMWAGSNSAAGGVSSGGRYVLFTSSSSCLAPNDESHFPLDYFVRDVGSAVGVGSGAGAGDTPGPQPLCPVADLCIGAAQTRGATDGIGDVLADDTADLLGARLSYRPQYGDVFGVVDVARLAPLGPVAGPVPLVNDAGADRVLYGMRFTAGAQRYEIRATGALGGRLGLFACDDTPTRATCTSVATLRGGYGTTGDRVVFSLPTALVSDGAHALFQIEAFSAVGTYATGAVRDLDTVTVAGLR